jgi:integrase
MVTLVEMLILTGQRRAEVGGMRWSEVDIEAKTWTLPRSRVKNDTAHVVPLCDASVAILKSAHRVEGDYVFTFCGDKALVGYGLLKRKIDDLLPEEMPHWTLHDLRRTFASGSARHCDSRGRKAFEPHMRIAIGRRWNLQPARLCARNARGGGDMGALCRGVGERRTGWKCFRHPATKRRLT